jgi:hypothetical protein
MIYGGWIMRVRMMLFSAAVLLLMVLAGCDVGTEAAHKAVTVKSTGAGLQRGWLRYESPEFSLDVPDTWVKLDVSGEDLQEVLDSVSDSNPRLAQYMKGSEFKRQLSGFAAQGVRLLLYDTDINLDETPFATNLNLVRMKIPKGMKLDEVVRENISELERVFGDGLLTPINREYASLGGKTGEKISYTYRVELPYNGSLDIDLQQIITVKDDMQYILTLTTPNFETRWRARTFDMIAMSFKIPK